MRQKDEQPSHLVVVTEMGRGAALKARAKRLGIDVNRLADEMTSKGRKISREQLGQILNDNVPNTRSWDMIEATIDELEAEAGRGPLMPEQSSAKSPVKFKISGVYGVAEVIVEGPVENLPELEAAVERLLLRAQGKGDAE